MEIKKFKIVHVIYFFTKVSLVIISSETDLIFQQQPVYFCKLLYVAIVIFHSLIFFPREDDIEAVDSVPRVYSGVGFVRTANRSSLLISENNNIKCVF